MQYLSDKLKGKSSDTKAFSKLGPNKARIDGKLIQELSIPNEFDPLSEIEPSEFSDLNSEREKEDKERRIWLQHMVLMEDGFSDPPGFTV
jgi:hypothetical protein